MITNRHQIHELLCTKASNKQKVFRQMKEVFGNLKTIASNLSGELKEEMSTVDQAVTVDFEDRNAYEGVLKFGGDVLLLNMHTNVFSFPKSHRIWKTSYVRENSNRGYFGIIHLYNFMADSLKYDHQNDVGVLLGRIFINGEGHFFVEGQKELSTRFADLERQEIDSEMLSTILETAIIFALQYDLTAPEFKDVMMVSVEEMRARSSELRLRTGKPLGFKPEK